MMALKIIESGKGFSTGMIRTRNQVLTSMCLQMPPKIFLVWESVLLVWTSHMRTLDFPIVVVLMLTCLRLEEIYVHAELTHFRSHFRAKIRSQLEQES